MADDQIRVRGVVASPRVLLESIEVEQPLLVEAINEYERALGEVLPALDSADPHPAVLVVAVVAMNDFNDLLFDCISGRGRSALRASRVQFEHLLNLTAMKEPAMLNRFMSHSGIGTPAVARWNPLEHFLKGKQLKAARHRKRVLLRDSRKQMEEVLSEYGHGFSLQWHPKSIRQRAIDAGLEEEYEFYRASSAAVHGSASTMDGSVWFSEGRPISRVGPVVITCPSAMAGGLWFYTKLNRTLEGLVDLRAASLLPTLQRLGAMLPEFCSYTNALEEGIFRLDGMERPTTDAQLLLLPEPSAGAELRQEG